MDELCVHAEGERGTAPMMDVKGDTEVFKWSAAAALGRLKAATAANENVGCGTENPDCSSAGLVPYVLADVIRKAAASSLHWPQKKRYSVSLYEEEKHVSTRRERASPMCAH